MTPFWDPLNTGFRWQKRGKMAQNGVPKGVQKVTQKGVQKWSRGTLVSRHGKATVRPAINGVKNDPKNDPFLGPPKYGFRGQKRSISAQKGSKKGVQKVTQKGTPFWTRYHSAYHKLPTRARGRARVRARVLSYHSKWCTFGPAGVPPQRGYPGLISVSRTRIWGGPRPPTQTHLS